ncbi:ROK family protein [Niabella ginsengisoli]|uniref:ROK family protein n=1 Tax=Niabella ginsengisoli TaxID=522298 RepID=A0ABS9SDN4_9BACT|nr:ROK family protein [Niabella ginsengisoli]MCH5596470.1 ROK family protein [Niabella ginsengisoli]
MMNKNIGLGIDVGGSHITAALVDLDQYYILKDSRFRGAVNSKGSVNEISEAWLDVINRSLNCCTDAVTRIGIAMPGPFDYENGISLIKDNNKYEALYGINIKTLLSEALSIAPEQITFSNDAACFLKGEIVSDDTCKYERVVGLTLGTGLGSARFKDNLAEDANRWCMPFLEGIAEDYISTRWFLQRYFERCGEMVKDVKALVEQYTSNKLIAEIFDEFAKNLALFVQTCVKEDGAETVIIGGNIANANKLFYH